MDSLNHAAQGIVLVTIGEALTRGVMTDAGGSLVSAGIGAALVGAAPDAIGFIEKLVKRDRNAWSWYGKAHSIEALTIAVVVCCWGLFVGPWWIIAYALAYILHLLLDMMTHVDLGANHNWYPPSAMWKEDFWSAVRWCKWNWLSWSATIVAYVIVKVLS